MNQLEQFEATVMKLKENKRYKELCLEYRNKFFGIPPTDTNLEEQFHWIMDQLGELKNLPLPVRLYIRAMEKLKLPKGDVDSVALIKELLEVISSFNGNITEVSEAYAGNVEHLRELYFTQLKSNLRSIGPLIRKAYALPIPAPKEEGVSLMPIVDELSYLINDLTEIRNQYKNK